MNFCKLRVSHLLLHNFHKNCRRIFKSKWQNSKLILFSFMHMCRIFSAFFLQRNLPIPQFQVKCTKIRRNVQFVHNFLYLRRGKNNSFRRIVYFCKIDTKPQGTICFIYHHCQRTPFRLCFFNHFSGQRLFNFLRHLYSQCSCHLVWPQPHWLIFFYPTNPHRCDICTSYLS